MSIAGILRRWVLVSAVTGVLALIQVPGVRAQAVPPSPAVSPADVGSSQPVQMPPNPNPNQPVPTAPSPGPLNSPANGVTGAPGMAPGTVPGMAPGTVPGMAPGTVPGMAPGTVPGMAPGTVPGTAPGTVPGMAPGAAPGMAPGMVPGSPPAAPAGYSSGLSTLDVIYESIFGDIYTKQDMARWTPMTLGGFFSFSDGWDTPYVFPKNSDNGTPRHAWLGTGGLGGVFYRAWFFAFAYVHDIGPKNNFYLGQYTIFVPLNRRFQWQFDFPFINSNKGGTSHTTHGNIGDLTIHNRFMLSESDKFGQLFELAVRVPTGAQDNGNGVASISPTYSIWWTPAPNWSVRGLTGPTVATNHAKDSGYSTYQNSLAIGRYFKGSDDGWIQQLWFYLVASENSAISGPHRESAFSLEPGLRCRVPFLSKVGTGYWYAFASVNVPMAGPPHSHDDYAMTYAFLYDY